jgi:hypothetical protein
MLTARDVEAEVLAGMRRRADGPSSALRNPLTSKSVPSLTWVASMHTAYADLDKRLGRPVTACGAPNLLMFQTVWNSIR